MLEKLKLLYPAVDADILLLVLEQAEQFVLDYCNLEEIPTALHSVLLDMCKQDINRIGAEGYQSESAGGANLSYETDYSQNVYKRLQKHKRIKLI